MKFLYITFGIVLSFLSCGAAAGLVGSNLTIGVEGQFTSASERLLVTESVSKVVDANEIEFPNLNSLQNEIASENNIHVLNLDVDAGDDYIILDFDNIEYSGNKSFFPGFFNGYVFTFDSNKPIEFTSVLIDYNVTNLALDDSDIEFSKNTLAINVESLVFNKDSYVKVDLKSVGGGAVVDVPEPEHASLVLLGLAVAILRRMKS